MTLLDGTQEAAGRYAGPGLALRHMQTATAKVMDVRMWAVVSGLTLPTIFAF